MEGRWDDKNIFVKMLECKIVNSTSTCKINIHFSWTTTPLHDKVISFINNNILCIYKNRLQLELKDNSLLRQVNMGMLFVAVDYASSWRVHIKGEQCVKMRM